MNLSSLGSGIEAGFTWAWQTSLAASVLTGLVMLALVPLRKFLSPKWRYALWLLVLLRLLAPSIPRTGFSILNLENLGSSTGFTTSGSTEMPPTFPPAPMISLQENSTPRPLTAKLALAPSRGRVGWPPILRSLWLTGAIGSFLFVWFQHRKLATWIKRQIPDQTPRLTALVEAAQAIVGVGGRLPIILAKCQGTPAVFGFHKPCLLLPRSALESLDDDELRLVLLHELVHVRRRDVLLNWAAIVAQSIHWFNPLIWFALKQWRAERELVCDSEVVRKLTLPERRCYGNTLLKLATSSQPVFAPSLAPIIQHQHQIERRITMIAQYKPSNWPAAVAAGALLVTLGLLTFTSAAEKGSTKADQAAENAHVIRNLESEYAKIEERIKRQQAELNSLKEKLRIADGEFDAVPRPLLTAENLQKMELSRVQAQGRCASSDALYQKLSGLKRTELKQAILVTFPDQQLAESVKNEAEVQQKLADLLTHFSAEHPEVQRSRKVLETLTNQINERLEGFLAGLKAKAASNKAEAEALAKAMNETKEIDIKVAIERRPFYQAKHDLEALVTLRERLKTRLVEEKIKAGLPLNPEVEANPK